MGAADAQTVLFQFQISVAMKVTSSELPGGGDGDSGGDGANKEQQAQQTAEFPGRAGPGSSSMLSQTD